MFPNLLELVIARLNADKGRWNVVAEKSGVPERTIEKVARRETPDPRVSTLQRLADYYAGLDQGAGGKDSPPSTYVSEPGHG